MFDSPFEYCSVCGAHVLLDQTHRQCAEEHSCALTSTCPFESLFLGMEFREEGNSPHGPNRGDRST